MDHSPNIKMNREVRPWGVFEIISDTDLYKLKKLTIFTGESISLQYHKYRTEIWYIISGTGTVINCDKDSSIREEFEYIQGDTFEILQESVHKISATTKTEVFEVQIGSYFGEDDIIRLDDECSRIKEGVDK